MPTLSAVEPEIEETESLSIPTAHRFGLMGLKECVASVDLRLKLRRQQVLHNWSEGTFFFFFFLPQSA